jgi:hypothetical protein
MILEENVKERGVGTKTRGIGTRRREIVFMYSYHNSGH